MGDNQEGSIEFCERQQWSADVRRCMANATTQQQLGQCYQMLPPASTQEIDALVASSDAAVRQLEVYGEQMCACKNFNCAKDVMSTAAPFVQGMPTVVPEHKARLVAAGERFKGCAKPYLSKK